MTKELLKTFQEITQKQDIDLYIEMLQKEKDADAQLYFNCLCGLIETFASQYEKITAKTLKMLESKNDLSKNKNITANELLTIAGNFRNEINFARGYELRQKPKYDKTIADAVSKEIQDKGLINYLDDILKHLHLGSNRNIYRKLLMGFNVMRGYGSYLSETIAESGAGKSHEDSIVFLKMIPQQYIFRKNLMTFASFTRYADITPYYFDRFIIYFGDLGSKKSYKKIEDVFDIIKILITENEYSRDLADKTITGSYENISLYLKVSAIGGVYSSINNSFTEEDNQLESRTLKSTPYPVNQSDLLDFIGYLDYTESAESKAKRDAEKELKRFQHYLLSLVNTDIQIINPYIEYFKRYVKDSDIVVREFTQLIELFNAYCLLTYYDCDSTYKNHYVASSKQLNDFFTNIALENTLKPTESNFLKMLIAENKKYQLTLISDDPADAKITECFNTVLEDVQEQKTLSNYDYINSIEDLDITNQNITINKLMKNYRLAGISADHKENIFFTVKDINKIYRKHKAYKDVNDVSKMLYRLSKKGYIEKLEYQYRKQNIYYLTSKCENISSIPKFDKEIIFAKRDYLENIGI